MVCPWREPSRYRRGTTWLPWQRVPTPSEGIVAVSGFTGRRGEHVVGSWRSAGDWRDRVLHVRLAYEVETDASDPSVWKACHHVANPSGGHVTTQLGSLRRSRSRCRVLGRGRDARIALRPLVPTAALARDPTAAGSETDSQSTARLCRPFSCSKSLQETRPRARSLPSAVVPTCKPLLKPRVCQARGDPRLHLLGHLGLLRIESVGESALSE